MIQRALPLLAIAALAVGLSLSIVELVPARAPAPVAPIASEPEVLPPPSEAETDYTRALDALNAQLAAAERGNERHPNQWMRIEQVVGLYVARARLTGDHDDYLRAQDLLGQAFAIAPEGSGPLLTRAHLHFTLHRMNDVEPDLAQAERAVLVPPTTRADIAGLRGDVALHTGRLEDAERLHREAEELDPHAASAFRIAYDLWQTGRFAEAERWLTLAETRVSGGGKDAAWMALQRGLLHLDRGQLDEALGHYRRADRLFGGWWLVEEHIAEIHALRGEHEEAERRYRDLIRRTESPEFMDALAGVLEERGAEEEARTWRARATEVYEHQLETLPEASYGHALGHFLEHGDAARALELARANHAIRPGGEATIGLAQALLRSGETEAARAAEQAELARAIDPGALDDLEWL